MLAMKIIENQYFSFNLWIFPLKNLTMFILLRKQS